MYTRYGCIFKLFFWNTFQTLKSKSSFHPYTRIHTNPIAFPSNCCCTNFHSHLEKRFCPGDFFFLFPMWKSNLVVKTERKRQVWFLFSLGIQSLHEHKCNRTPNAQIKCIEIRGFYALFLFQRLQKPRKYFSKKKNCVTLCAVFFSLPLCVHDSHFFQPSRKYSIPG